MQLRGKPLPNTITASGHILLVDDQPANLRVVTTLLERQGYRVTTAGDGESALDACRRTKPDLLLLDMMMPGMDGFALMREIKRDPSLMRIPTIFLTAAQDRELLLRAFDVGAVDYVTKPFIPEELLARVNAHVVLKLTRDRLERMAKERQDLVNLVAHDLKNPLTSVLFASDMMMQPDMTPERSPRYLKVIHEATQDAIAYIRAYLEGQADRQRAARGGDESASLKDTVEWLLDRYGPQLEAQGFRIERRLPRVDLLVRISPMVLRQVAENLVTNASKYAAEGGELTFSAAEGAVGHARLLVEDRGPGIPPARQRELFKPFTRLVDNDQGDGLSSGLGLSLARRIVMDCEGQLHYEDREGGGARFIIELPKAVPSATPA